MTVYQYVLSSTGNYYQSYYRHHASGGWEDYTPSKLARELGLPTVKGDRSRELYNRSLELVSEADMRTISNKTKEIAMADKLFEFEQDGKTVHGTRLAINSAGMWVMEVKGTGGTAVINKADAEEVIPHSIRIMTQSGHKKHVLCDAGVVEKDAFYFARAKGSGGFEFIQVIEVDTKTATNDECKILGKASVDAAT